MTIKDILKELNLSFQERGGSGFLNIDCPYCGRPGKPGMGIHMQSLKASCFKCGSHWTPRVLADASRQSIPDIMKLLAGIASFLPSHEPRGLSRYTPPPGVGPLLPIHQQYLKHARRKAGFDPDKLVAEWGLEGIGPDSEYQWRLFVPVTLYSRPVSWSTRAIGDVQPPYLSAKPGMESVPIKHTIFGLDHVKHAVVVVEGWIDAMAIGPGAGAIYGLQYTWEQVLLLSRIPTRYICLDNEPAAQRQAQKLANDLSIFPGTVSILQITTGKDAADCSEGERCEIRKLLE